MTAYQNKLVVSGIAITPGQSARLDGFADQVAVDVIFELVPQTSQTTPDKLSTILE